MRRIAEEQLDRALGEIEDDLLDLAETVHQARKRCKRVRGALPREAEAARRAGRRLVEHLAGPAEARTRVPAPQTVLEG